MIEGFFSVFPVKQLKIFTLMLDMAGLTLPEFFVCMSAFPGSDTGGKQGMAGKAFLSRQLLSAFMATGTISNTF
jgi:hypothetical protein